MRRSLRVEISVMSMPYIRRARALVLSIDGQPTRHPTPITCTGVTLSIFFCEPTHLPTLQCDDQMLNGSLAVQVFRRTDLPIPDAQPFSIPMRRAPSHQNLVQRTLGNAVHIRKIDHTEHSFCARRGAQAGRIPINTTQVLIQGAQIGLRGSGQGGRRIGGVVGAGFRVDLEIVSTSRSEDVGVYRRLHAFGGGRRTDRANHRSVLQGRVSGERRHHAIRRAKLSTNECAELLAGHSPEEAGERDGIDSPVIEHAPDLVFNRRFARAKVRPHRIDLQQRLVDLVVFHDLSPVDAEKLRATIEILPKSDFG